MHEIAATLPLMRHCTESRDPATHSSVSGYLICTGGADERRNAAGEEESRKTYHLGFGGSPTEGKLRVGLSVESVIK